MILRKGALKFPLGQWVDILKGQPAFIIGNGPSLNEVDLPSLRGYLTIGCNRAYKKILPTILMWQDASLYTDCYDDLLTLPCVKMCRKEIDADNRFNHFSLVNGGYAFGRTPNELHGGGCTGVLAAQLAVAMGCGSLVLIGCDCQYKDGKTDFYGVNHFHSERTVDNFMRAMQWLSESSPVKVFNCGDAPFWPKTPLPSALETLKPKQVPHFQRLVELRRGSAESKS